MAQKGEEITFRCEFHRSINGAEIALGRVIEHLWGEAWPPPRYRESVFATKPRAGEDQLLTRRVAFTFNRNQGPPYREVHILMRKPYPYIPEWWPIWAIIQLNPGHFFPFRPSGTGPVYIKFNNGELEMVDPQHVPDELKTLAFA